eukprot:Colp12_sorted_trinity150504_noHs@7074
MRDFLECEFVMHRRNHFQRRREIDCIDQAPEGAPEVAEVMVGQTKTIFETKKLVLASASRDTSPVGTPRSSAKITSAMHSLQQEKTSRFDFAKFLASTLDVPSDRLIEVFANMVNTGALDVILQWACGMDSEEHKPAAIVIAAITKLLNSCHVPTLRNQSWWKPVEPQLIYAVEFLVTVSPIETPITPVRGVAEKAMEAYHRVGLDVGQKPYFGPGHKDSPVLSQLWAKKQELCNLFNSYHQLEELKSLAHVDGEGRSLIKGSGIPLLDLNQVHTNSLRIGSSDVFKAFGTHSNNQYGKEYERASEVCNAILSGPPPFFTTGNIKALHSTLDLEPGKTAGVFRDNLVVGSFRFYEFYRVFAPIEEVEKACLAFERDFNSEEVQSWHPVLRAFYIYTALVHFIHPFEDGNGRLSRLLANMCLMQNGYPGVWQYDDKVVPFNTIMDRVVSTASLLKKKRQR